MAATASSPRRPRRVLVAQEPQITGTSLPTTPSPAAPCPTTRRRACRPSASTRAKASRACLAASNGARPSPAARRAAGRAAPGRAHQPPRHLRHRDPGGDVARAARRCCWSAMTAPSCAGDPAMLLAGGQARLAAGQGLFRLRPLVGEDRRRPGRGAAPSRQTHRARDLLVPPLHHRPAHAQRGPRPPARRDAAAQDRADARADRRLEPGDRFRRGVGPARDRGARDRQGLRRAKPDQELFHPHPARRPVGDRRAQRRGQFHAGQDPAGWRSYPTLAP